MRTECPKCKGTGLVRDKLEVIATLGISWIMDKLAPSNIGKESCPKCKGKGYLKILLK